jgi:hypothetical protein
MNAKRCALFLTTYAALAFNAGCTTRTVYVPQEVLVPAPVACDVPEPVCDSSKVTDTELLTEARLCIKRTREALHYCTH